MITMNSRIGDLMQNPIARDVIDRLTQYAGVSEKLVMNPLVRALKLSALPKFAGKAVKDVDAVLETMIALFNQEEGVEAPAPSDEETWWKEAVVYQIYPRSFKDGNGDGIGDIKGVISKLDYLQSLGVTAIWFSPIFDSPNDDNGYDVRDYRAIMREFGDMADVETLISELHRRDMRIVLDLVLNHTSDEHAWFVDSAQNPQGAHGDFYYWRTGENGKRPNNWTSFFSGPAWDKVEGRDDWYLHLFSKKQPDLNWENPAVRDEIASIIRFWREKGADGFRLDVINYISKTSLSDGNETLGGALGFTGVEHYFYGVKLHEYLREMRQRAFGDAFTVGETPGTGAEMNKLLTADARKELSTVFCFDHLEMPGHNRYTAPQYDLNHLKKCFLAYETDYADVAWPSIFVENHDNPRMVSKVDGRAEYREVIAKLLAVLLLTARGVVFLYQGQELGAVNVGFQSMDELRDVESLNLYAELVRGGKSETEAFETVVHGTRDHARTPMQWTNEIYGGFSEHEPWIRMGDQAVCNVRLQEDDPNSVLNAYRRLIALRRDNRALVYGTFEPIERERGDLFCYERAKDGERFRVEVNLCSRTIRPPKRGKGLTLAFSNYADRSDALRPYEANIYRVSSNA